MLDQTTKRKLDSARQILVGKVPDPKAQVEQIITALIYKFMDDMDKENEEVGLKTQFFVDDWKKFSWTKILDNKLSGQERLDLYVQAITNMPKNPHIPQLFRNIFKGVFLPYNDPRTLSLFLKEINEFNYEHSENLGNAFEYLLSILGSQGDAGQFRTPRHIIDFIVEVVDPKKNETILDPACGTAGFLISAYKHILKQNKTKALTPDEKLKLMNNLAGYDISPDMVKLALVNMYLHGFPEPKIHEYDTLSSEKRWDETFDVIMANPPFMTPKGGIVPHKRFSIQANRAEVLFVDYIVEHLTVKGRAGIIVPEGVIFQSNTAYTQLRKKLVEDGLFAVVSLPAGVFNPYAGVKTSILFLDKEIAKKSDCILFVKIDNDGFNLGAQRRKIDKNDLPRTIDIITRYKNSFANKDVFLTGRDVHDNFALLVRKDEIAKSGDYNLIGDRYKIDLYVSLQNITQNLEKIFEPYKETLKQIQKQTEPYRKLTEQLQKQAKQVNRVFASPIFQETQKNIQKVAEQMQKAFKNVDFQQIIEQQKRLQEELKKRQKWEMVELGDSSLFQIESGGTPDSGNVNYWNGDIFWATLADLPQEERITEIKDTKRKITEEGLKKSSAKILPKNSILVSSRATIGRIGITKVSLATNQGFKNIIIKDFSKVDPVYLANILTQKIDEMQGLASGGTFKEISKTNFSKIKIPLPPIEVQKEIVEQIEVKQNAIDHAKAIIQNLERGKRYFGQSLRKLEGVEWVELVEVCEELFAGGDVPKDYSKTKNKEYTIPIYSNGVKNKGLYGFTKKARVNKEAVTISARGTIGFPEMRSQPFYPAIRLIVAIPKKDIIDVMFLKYILDTIDIYRNGNSIPQLTVPMIKSEKIPLPSLKVQKKLVAEAEKEQQIINANKRLIEIYEQKILEVLSDI